MTDPADAIRALTLALLPPEMRDGYALLTRLEDPALVDDYARMFGCPRDDAEAAVREGREIIERDVLPYLQSRPVG